jgi:energy-coupling factor transporter ATP-binding protein EcfA2
MPAVHFAVPKAGGDRGAINVLAGPNNSGKSYTMERIAEVLRDRISATRNPKSSDLSPTKRRDFEIDVQLTSDEVPQVTLLRQNSQHMGQCGTVNLHTLERKLDLPNDLPDYRRRFRDFFLRQVGCHLGGSFVERFYATKPDSGERRLLFEPIEPIGCLYLCDQRDALVRRMQEVLGASLYFRCSQKAPQQILEFVLAYDDGSRVPFDEWSSGQKFNFYAGTLLALTKPDIVLLDEIENHLHPAYITRLLEALREGPRQSVLVTHHPHVIFSELVDAVFYMERSTVALPDPPIRLAYDKHRDKHSPTRRILALEDQFERISHAYKLFDSHDNQLMKLAVQLEGEAELMLCREITRLFTYPPMPSSARKLPDTQGFQLAQRVRDLLDPRGRECPLTILDCGAGLGRLAHELEKIPAGHQSTLEWIFWEPSTQFRQKLRAGLEGTSLKCRVLEALEEVPSNSVSLCLLCNVLHELTVEDAARLLSTAADKMLGNDGALVVMEIYPLLSAEKYAVPYPEQALLGILDSAGMSADSMRFPVGAGLASAYCLMARAVDLAKARDVDTWATAIQSAWDLLERQALSQYSNRRSIQSFVQYRDLLQQMTTIASIGAWRNHLWRSRPSVAETNV